MIDLLKIVFWICLLSIVALLHYPIAKLFKFCLLRLARIAEVGNE